MSRLHESFSSTSAWRVGALAALALLHAGAVCAQVQGAVPRQPTEAERTAQERLQSLQVYRPDFYDAFRPQNALDMLMKTPGFKLETGATTRGLDGAAGNVLVNGVRPPAKAAPITQVLSSIPAGEVVAILLVPAGTMDVDMAGYAVLANVIRKMEAGTERTIGMQASDSGRDGHTQQVDADVQVNRGRVLVSGNAQDSRTRMVTPGGLAMPLAGQSSARRSSGVSAASDNTAVSGTVQWQLPQGARLQIRVNLSQLESNSQPLPDPEAQSDLDSSSDMAQRARDLAGELQWPLAGSRGELSLTALHTRRDTISQARVRSDGRTSLSRSRSLGEEAAVRGGLRWKPSGSWRLNLGVDHAFNTSDGDFRYLVDGIDIDVPGSASRVEESRSGVSASLSWLPDAAWTHELGLRRETSVLRNRAEGGGTARFDDLLPKFTSTWLPVQGHKLQASAERKAGQLAFSQFLASVNLEDQIVTGGAAALEPERSWTYGLDYEWRFGERGLFNAGLSRRHIDNPIDVRVVEGLQVSGNVDAATVDALSLGLTAPLDGVGLPGGLLTLNHKAAWSRTVDPVTGEPRGVSGVAPRSSSLQFRQDLPGVGFSWGLTATGPSDTTQYAVHQVMRMRRDASATLFGEWRPRDALALRLTWANGGLAQTETLLFDGPRRAGLAPDLAYLAGSYQMPTWRAAVEWEPSKAMRLELGASTGMDVRMSGRTRTGDGAETLEVLDLPKQPTFSANLRLRW